MPREIATILLLRGRLPPGRLAGTCEPPWHPWARGGVARAEPTADGRVHLVVVRRRAAGVIVTVTGVGAAQAESLAPLAARVARALPGRPGDRLRGTSAFEDAVMALLAEHAAPAAARRGLLALGRPCPAARRLRTMPTPRTVSTAPTAVLAAALGSRRLARRVQALARGFDALTPAVPSAS